MTKKASQATIAQRVSEVSALLLSGKRREDILQHASKSGWEVSARSVDTYIRKATAAIETEASIDRAAEFALAKARLNFLYEKAVTGGDLNTARLVLAELHKLLSLYLPPAPQTLRLLGIDNAQLEELVRTLHEAGHDPAAVFDRMIQRAAAEKAKTDGR